MTRKVRVESDWSPESSYLFITRPKDMRLAKTALQAAADAGNQEARQLLDRVLAGNYGNSDELTLKRNETHIVTDAITKSLPTLDSHPFKRRRAISLVGSLVTAADTQLVNL